MKAIYLLAILGIVSGCKKLQNCTPDKQTYTFVTGKRINVDTIKVSTSGTPFERYTTQIVNGENIVFDFTHQFKECRDIMDDERVDRVLFEVPSSASTFKWTDSAAFHAAKTFYFNIGAWGMPPLPVKSGLIEGYKIDNNRWHIKASLNVSPNGSNPINFEHDFFK